MGRDALSEWSIPRDLVSVDPVLGRIERAQLEQECEAMYALGVHCLRCAQDRAAAVVVTYPSFALPDNDDDLPRAHRDGQLPLALRREAERRLLGRFVRDRTFRARLIAGELQGITAWNVRWVITQDVQREYVIHGPYDLVSSSPRDYVEYHATSDGDLTETTVITSESGLRRRLRATSTVRVIPWSEAMASTFLQMSRAPGSFGRF